MKFKGFNFRKVRTVVQLPYDEGESTSYIKFGRISKESDKGAILTRYKFADSGLPVYAKPIPNNGYSLTNMMYGKDGRVYLMKDGQFFTAVLNNQH